ncbi:RNB domain-containing ribonuclease [Dissulfurirhabdus thermomarina]|uniref:RNB domain-containing ribonuclease n=1 Tax=Dissulfurirhabdus thermomarina TaxID=1765737 RepID=A0A6N9TL17_DISTH|nr:ribonuclease catalytic domain-containing protein [Dissulfurirhabdus thermomarina]NDY41758.1 RNB domain-containing ribonuclease [Dissulfurirhabdus thermomarina]NMX24031.1 RNB domain-containing ribonuclease [Dissulfurirhabdus thermomarina]
MTLDIGQVVEYLEAQRFICGLCLGRKGARSHVLTHLGREVNLAPNRFLHVSRQRLPAGTREEHLDRLRRIWERRDALAARVDIVELWNLVHDERPAWSPAELAGLAFSGPVSDDHAAALIRAVITEQVHFKFRDGAIQVRSPEEVARSLERRRQEAERAARLSAGSAWLQALWGQGAPPPGLDPEQVRFWTEALRGYCLHGDEAPHAAEARQVLKTVHRASPAGAFETLVRAGVFSRDENLELLRLDLQADFSAEVEAEARRLAAAPTEPDGREDLRDLDTFTVDAPESQDLDDALSLRPWAEGLEVGVHITDIGLRLPPGSPAFEEAMARGTSIYLPDQRLPMLPEVLSQEAWSLREGAEMPAVSFLARLTPEGELRDYRITRSLVRIRERLGYREADARLAAEGPLKALHGVCRELQRRRVEAGALPLPIPDLVIRVDPDGTVHVSVEEPGPSRFLVAECMILANSLAAAFLRDHRIPGLFRSQPPPKQRLIDGIETDLVANFRQRRLISRGVLGPEPEFHHGLGVAAYTTVTSPLRRALDLLMQQQIASTLRDGRPLHGPEDLARYGAVLGEGLRKAAAARQARVRYWILRHLEQRAPARLRGRVLESGPRRVLVLLEDYLMVGELPRRPGRHYPVGDAVEVTVRKVDARENVLKLDWP